MENPYQSSPPAFDFSAEGSAAPLPAPGQRMRGLVGHIRIVGILMMVQGVLSLLIGLLFFAMGIFAGVVISMDPPRAGPNDPPAEFMALILGGTYGTMGLAGIIPGILQIYAGLKTYRFQSRSLGMIALFSGLGSMFTCYCAPTSLALLVYGLIVFCDASVREAFELAKQGHSADVIDLMFNPLYMQQQQQAKPPL